MAGSSSDQADRALVLGVSAAKIDRLLVETKIAAAGGNRKAKSRLAGLLYSSILTPHGGYRHISPDAH
ncbi:hypothetical protein HU230_0042035 (plasmid) [Bradyrhizobium quebecense]|uniref:Uncharacterized protein n=1 Tax=Bradyrhizobium quebecense TaxID=2748629 RepID=A0A973WZG7_9BRAD|nr:hypothetical protein [Bradyrhizobium quebecense]UGA48842.1 hypothetical protein HU230_0042035 [Bradyrhizobium quebecense]